jgi:hypothetical protein
MKRLLWAGAFFLLLGCKSVVGPFGYRTPERVDDPRLPIAEQERRGRDRYALPDASSYNFSQTYSDSYNFARPN